jgi:hypothetical protein
MVREALQALNRSEEEEAATHESEQLNRFFNLVKKPANHPHTSMKCCWKKRFKVKKRVSMESRINFCLFLEFR